MVKIVLITIIPFSFAVKFNEELFISAKVLIDDDFSGKPSRYASCDVSVITVEGFEDVKSNLDYLFEDSINKALINEFHNHFVLMAQIHAHAQ